MHESELIVCYIAVNMVSVGSNCWYENCFCYSVTDLYKVSVIKLFLHTVCLVPQTKMQTGVLPPKSFSLGVLLIFVKFNLFTYISFMGYLLHMASNLINFYIKLLQQILLDHQFLVIYFTTSF